MSTRIRIIGGGLGIVLCIAFFVLFVVFKMIKLRDPISVLANLIQIICFVASITALLWNYLCVAKDVFLFFLCTILRINKTWIYFIAKSGFESQPMVTSFLKCYIKEEIEDIRGVSQKNKSFIVTNFVAYSRFVSAVIHAAYKKCPDNKEVICFTTLTMPLSKWFNFSENKNANFKYCGVHTEWEKYANDLRKLTYYDGTNKMPIVIIRRCILAVQDDFTDTSKDLDFAFIRHTEMQNHFNHWMLVPDNDDINRLKPLQKSQIIDLFKKDLSPLKPDIGFYANSDYAYLILPDNNSKQGNTLPIPSGFKWSRLGRVFMKLFHSYLYTDNAKYTIFKPDEWNSCFSPSLPVLQRMPEDLFIIGFRCKGTDSLPEWVFCLAGNVDSKLDKLTLEIVTKNNQDRLYYITNYVNSLWLNKSSKLHDWLKPD